MAHAELPFLGNPSTRRKIGTSTITNQMAGTAVLVAGARTVPNTAVTANHICLATVKTLGTVTVPTAVQCAVRRLPLTAQDADQTTRVAASLEGQPSGQLIEVDMPLQVREGVLWLPPAAVRTFQSRTFVVLQTADGERAVDVEIGLQTDDRVEIVSGVNEGDVVVAP